jgi:hypothetical protein
MTSSHAQQDIPIVCDLTAIPAEERAAHETRGKHLWFEAFQERHELADGYAFRFRAEDYPLVVAFIANERLCCSFFRFVVEVTPGQGPIWLRITGPAGAKEAVQAAYPLELLQSATSKGDASPHSA